MELLYWWFLWFHPAGPLASIQVPDTTNFNMNELVDQFKTIAVRAGFDNTYIDTAVKNIYSTEKESMAGTEISEYLKTLPSDMCEDPSKDQFRTSHDQWSNDERTGIVWLSEILWGSSLYNLWVTILWE